MDGSIVAIETTAAGVETADSWPKKDFIVYDTALASGNRLTTITGTPVKSDPPETIRQQIEQPALPSLNRSVAAIDGDGEPKILIAGLSIPNGADSITAADVFARRTGVAPSVSRLDAANTVAILELSRGIIDSLHSRSWTTNNSRSTTAA